MAEDQTEAGKLPGFCPSCHRRLIVVKSPVSTWPYPHVDLMLFCDSCNSNYVFGIPEDREAGLSLHVYHSDKRAAIDNLISVDDYPICPFHRKRMKVTKIFGDKTGKKNTWRAQFKCPKCFYVDHENYNGEAPPRDTADTGGTGQS